MYVTARQCSLVFCGTLIEEVLCELNGWLLLEILTAPQIKGILKKLLTGIWATHELLTLISDTCCSWPLALREHLCLKVQQTICCYHTN